MTTEPQWLREYYELIARSRKALITYLELPETASDEEILATMCKLTGDIADESGASACASASLTAAEIE